jgi:hypothetical protein
MLRPVATTSVGRAVFLLGVLLVVPGRVGRERSDREGSKMTRRWLPLLLTMAVWGPAWAVALIEHRQEALKLILKQNTATGKAKAVWVSKSPLGVTRIAPDERRRAFIVTGMHEQVSAPLPAGNWQTNPAGTLYKFVNKAAPGGDSLCKVALIKQDKVLKVVCKDSLIQLDDSAQGTIAVALTIGTDTIGTDTYCSVCTTAVKDEPGQFIAKGCSAPADCSGAAPTTTTTTSATSTTLGPPVCGNGVVDAGEQCDGSAVGECESPTSCGQPGFSNECRCCLDSGPYTQYFGCCNPFSTLVPTPPGPE